MTPAVIRSARLLAFEWRCGSHKIWKQLLVGGQLCRSLGQSRHSSANIITMNLKSTEFSIPEQHLFSLDIDPVLRWETHYNRAGRRITQVWMIEYPSLLHLHAIIPWCHMQDKQKFQSEQACLIPQKVLFGSCCTYTDEELCRSSASVEEHQLEINHWTKHHETRTEESSGNSS